MQQVYALKLHGIFNQNDSEGKKSPGRFERATE